MLTGCKYEIFRRLCVDELNYRVIVPPREGEKSKEN